DEIGGFRTDDGDTPAGEARGNQALADAAPGLAQGGPADLSLDPSLTVEETEGRRARPIIRMAEDALRHAPHRGDGRRGNSVHIRRIDLSIGPGWMKRLSSSSKRPLASSPEITS